MINIKRKRLITLGTVTPITKRNFNRYKLQMNNRTGIQLIVRATAEIMGSEHIMANRKEIGTLIHRMCIRKDQLDALKIDYKKDPELSRLEIQYIDLLGTVNAIRFKLAFNKALRELN